jgi:transposase
VGWSGFARGGRKKARRKIRRKESFSEALFYVAAEAATHIASDLQTRQCEQQVPRRPKGGLARDDSLRQRRNPAERTGDRRLG